MGKRIGRPPAAWMYGAMDLGLDKRKMITRAELAEILNVSLTYIRRFLFVNCIKADTHRVENGRSVAYFKVAKIESIARKRCEAWL